MLWAITLRRYRSSNRLKLINFDKFIFINNKKLSTLLNDFKNVVNKRSDSVKDNSFTINNINPNSDNAQKLSPNELFEPYWSDLDVCSLKEKNPNLITTGTVSIPAFNTSDSYVKSGDCSNKIFGFIARNRSFHGDIVDAIKIRRLKNQSDLLNIDNLDFDEGCRIIRIIRRNPNIYKLVGTLKYSHPDDQQTNSKHAGVEQTKVKQLRVQPKDHRFPAFIIPEDTIRTDIIDKISDVFVTKKSYICTFSFHSWDTDAVEPTAKLLSIIGKSGNSKAEADALVNFYGFNHLEFNEDVQLECQQMDSLPDVERIDLTNIHTFTIDPPTAKDLDDAISIEPVAGSNKNFDIGVHIADVSHYVKPSTHIDTEAKIRATTVYLDHFVYPMLPRKLSEDLCSLLPGVTKKCFSVLFQLNIDTGNVTNIRFCKSNILSCYKLSYEISEHIINDINISELNISKEIVERIKLLHRVSKILKINRTKYNRGISITSDYAEQLYIPLVDNFPEFSDSGDKSCNPKSEYPKLKIQPLHPHSHSLIEELMVLTNRLVADHLLKHYKLSLFRIHQDTSGDVREHIIKHMPPNVLESIGADIKTIPIQKLLLLCKENIGSYEFDYINFIALQKFKEAYYIASARVESPDSHSDGLSDVGNHINPSHWGLGIDAYLHFTSPIRRYADIITHRLLEDSLCGNVYSYDCEYISSVASNCNVKKRLAFDAQIEYRSFIFNKYLQWACEYFKNSLIDGFIKCHDSEVCGYKSVGVAQEIILSSFVYEQIEKLHNIKFNFKQPKKTALSLYVPFLRQLRSLSLETLDLCPRECVFEYNSQFYCFDFQANELRLLNEHCLNRLPDDLPNEKLDAPENSIKRCVDKELRAISLSCVGVNDKLWIFKPMSTYDVLLISGSQMWSLRLY